MTQKNVLDSFRLDGRRALVTGGARGLGRVIASALAHAGAEVAITSRTLEDATTAALEISQDSGRRVLGFEGDVTKAEAVRLLGDSVEAELGVIDILVNNAGINIRGAAVELPEDDWETVLAVNLKAPFLCVQRFVPGMCDRGWGRVINLGSILSVIGIAGRTPYAAAKGGLLNMTRVMALEWAMRGVTANAICPGPFATDMNKPLLEDPVKYKAFIDKIPMGRWAELHEIAGAAVFLASDASSFVTGSALFVDGGWTAQ